MLVWQHHPRVVEDIEVDKATATNSSDAMSNETQSMPQPVYLKSKIIEEKTLSKTNVKPVKSYSSQMVTSSSCKDKADLKFIEFIKSFVGETDTYKALNWKIDYLHCKFFDLISDKSNKRITCSTNPTTVLAFKNTDALYKLKDYNKKDADTLFDYSQLLSQFLPSLSLIQTTMATAKLYQSRIQFIQNGLIQLQKALTETRKEIMKCSLVRPSSKPNSLDDIVLSFNDRVTKLRFTEEERAMAIFKQLQIVFSVMKEDLKHRKKCAN